MKEQKLIYSQTPSLLSLFRQRYGSIVHLAQECPDTDSFRKRLKAEIEWIARTDQENSTCQKKAAKHLLRLIDYDGKEIYELSTGQYITLEPLTLLWRLLNEHPIEQSDRYSDLLIDLYQQFESIFGVDSSKPIDIKRYTEHAKRWHDGLDEEVIAIRMRNKDRIIRKLVQKIDQSLDNSSRYHFPNGIDDEQKYAMVEQWWQTSHFHLSFAIKTPTGLNYFLDKSLSKETMQVLLKARDKGIPFFVTPYYLSLLDVENRIDDQTIRSYILYSKELVNSYGAIKAWEKEDQVEPGKPNAAGWLLPDGHNIHRRYPEVAILIPDSMGRACGGLCASCQRMYDFQSKRFCFDLESLKPKVSWNKKLEQLMRYFEEDTQIRDILITGGDALMSQNATLSNILEAIYQMALRKRNANRNRPEGERYAELQRVRIGSRLLAYLPMRVTDELVEILRSFREKAAQIGISQFIVQTHFQSPLEVTPEAEKAIRAILDTGWIITNQSVYTVAASRRGHAAKLRKTLNRLGIICYYNFTVKGFGENYNMFTPNARSLQEIAEEKIEGKLTQEQEKELHNLLLSSKWSPKMMNQFLRKQRLPFVATDRNTLNLPGIGKSMTFHTVGLLPDGRRILEFAHDKTRRHSPKVENMEHVFIAENKSIAAYLRQLDSIGERCDQYHSIWYYTEGETERRFSFFEYPDFDYRLTRLMNHLS